MMKKVIVAVIGLSIALASVVYAGEKSSADVSTPVGVWKTIDDETGEAKSYVKIWLEKDGTLSGKIIKVLTPLKPGDDPSRPCKECTGERKNQPVEGMTILWDLKPKKKGQAQKWHNGEILDPKNGKIYGCNLTLSNDGQTLEVRGYIGFSLLGRSQTWHRQE